MLQKRVNLEVILDRATKNTIKIERISTKTINLDLKKIHTITPFTAKC